jgi:hypothetical protein
LSIFQSKEKPDNRKDFLMNNLRIFGETFTPQQSKSFVNHFISAKNEISSQTNLTLKSLK